MSKENKSYIDDKTGKIILRSIDDKAEWTISEDSILIEKVGSEEEGIVLCMSSVTSVNLHTIPKKRFVSKGEMLIVSTGNTWNTIATNTILYDVPEFDIFEEARAFISGHMEIQSDDPNKQFSPSVDKRPRDDRSHIDEHTGEIVLCSNDYQESPKKNGKQWRVSDGCITVKQYGFWASEQTYPTAQITKIVLDNVNQNTLFGRMRIFVNGGTISVIGGNSYENEPTAFIRYFVYEHDIALKVREYIMDTQKSALTSSMPAPTTASQATSASVADEILKLKGLLDDGILTQEEFDQQKKKILER